MFLHIKYYFTILYILLRIMEQLSDFVKEQGKVTKKEVITLLNCKDTKAKMILKEMTETELTKITKGIYT